VSVAKIAKNINRETEKEGKIVFLTQCLETFAGQGNFFWPNWCRRIFFFKCFYSNL